MTKTTALLAALLLAVATTLSAQDTKGARPVNQSTNQLINQTRAVVVGISDYQDPAIPDLRFADRDAEAFANFLRSPAGGALDADHLKVLTNGQATMGKLAAALDWLLDVCREGDQAIIYFSGHGDVERKIFSQPGYLLCWDAPPQVYMSGGAFNLRDLEAIVSTLSTQNKVKTIIIADACHAGKLSGSGIGGAQITGASLARQYANEIKILSCQPNEYSVEGEQWGGGRGCFSYHLVEGLFGLADGNADRLVNLLEIGRYLEDRVTSEVAPQSQVPMVVGNRSERLAAVVPELLAQVQKNKSGQLPQFSPTDNRDIEDDVLASVDTSIRERYRLFKLALQDKIFMEPAGACADAYYRQLIAEPKLARLHNAMRRNFAAALQDDAQQVLNSFLKTDMNEITRTRRKKIEKYRPYPALLDRAAQLLGPEHYFYAELMSRKNIFEGFLKQLQTTKMNDRQAGSDILQYYRQALHWQPGNPLTYHFMARVYSNFMNDLDSAEYYILKVVEFAPGWVLPFGEFAYDLMYHFHKHEQAKKWLDHAISIDSGSAYLHNQYGLWYIHNGRYAEADFMLKKAISYDSTNIWYTANYAHACERLGKFQESEQACLRSIHLDSTNVNPYLNIGNLYVKKGELEKAEQWYIKAIGVDSVCSLCFSGLGILYTNMNRTDEAYAPLIKAAEIDTFNLHAWGPLGNLYLSKKNYAAAIEAFRFVIQIDSTNSVATYAHSGIGVALERTGKPDEAIEAFRRALQHDSTNIWAMCGWARALLKKGAPDEAESMVERAKGIKDSDWVGYHFALLYAQTGRPALALERLDGLVKKVIELDYNELQTEQLLAPLREMPEWKALMKKHFPDKVKD